MLKKKIDKTDFEKSLHFEGSLEKILHFDFFFFMMASLSFSMLFHWILIVAILAVP